jgi:hypothetical protein
MRRLEALGAVEVSWAVFSLAVANKGEEARRRADADAAPALRTTVLLREREGNQVVGRFYEALGTAIHVRKEQADGPEVITAALREAGADPSMYSDAMADPGTWETVLREHDAAVRDHHVFGVPTLVLDDGAGQSMFGPILCDLPGDDEARTLWQHVSWLMRYDNFAEVKRDRPRRPSFDAAAGSRGETAQRAPTAA